MIQHPLLSKAAATYNAAADHFDSEPLGFWALHGRRAVELAELQPGDRVVDIGCGTGASAIPAAIAVGPGGHVHGLDIAENMLVLARAKSREAGLMNTMFDLADMADPPIADGSADAVISVFSIFFAEQIETQVQRVWQMLRPGGKAVVTVWANNSFEPCASIFMEELRRVRPDMPKGARPWERLTDPNNLRDLMAGPSTERVSIHPARYRQPLTDPQDWWTIALGSGFRWEIDQLSPMQKQDVRGRVLARFDQDNIVSVELSALHAVAIKKGG